MYPKPILASAVALALSAPLSVTAAQMPGGMSFPGARPPPPNERQLMIVVDTGQAACYDSDGAELTCPAEGEDLHGQDAQNANNAASYRDNRNGTVTDNLTRLMWQQTPPADKYEWSDAQDYCESLSLAEHDDWRTPNLKELFSISDFTSGWPYIDTRFFNLNETPELKQLQYWSNNFYEVGTTHGGSDSAFGVNHGTGHIKAYPVGGDDGSGDIPIDGAVEAPTDGVAGSPPGASLTAKYVRCVRGNGYGDNAFVDNGDGTVTDRNNELMWSQYDSDAGVDWRDALAYAVEKNAAGYLGYSDWRLPNVKELQSIVDYSGSYPAIDTDYFNITDVDSYFWSSTSAYFSPAEPGFYYGWYVAFGYAVGGDGEDLHGAGAVRFDTKALDGPAGEDPERIFNYVRLVRDAEPQTQHEVIHNDQGCYTIHCRR
ncbi:Lcl C-terminal domain-containing protein [Thiocapsa marina]|uniref:Lcl C-terminal domain-containing protein n=1 Tax=Thiocapsa marina 5811 TaxID=768671 RepID=F9U5F5_9GAMM|nr:DUF1566 domain-containing protein [Thiocapsa marina]EGV20378.1 protein of unknown function DUF1566 [Thiocapsa marina 5811]